MVALVRRMRGRSADQASRVTRTPTPIAAIDPTAPLPTPEALVALGQRLARAGHRGAAHRAFRTAIGLQPRNAEAWLWRAGTADTPAEALECLERVLRLDPGNVRAHRGLAAVRAEVARSGGAVSADADRAERAVAARAACSPSALATARRVFWSLTLVASLGLAALPPAPERSAAIPVAALAESAVTAERPISLALQAAVSVHSDAGPGLAESFTAPSSGRASDLEPLPDAADAAAIALGEVPPSLDATGGERQALASKAPPPRPDQPTSPVSPRKAAGTVGSAPVAEPVSLSSGGSARAPAAAGPVAGPSTPASDPSVPVDRPTAASERSPGGQVADPAPRADRSGLSSILAIDGPATGANEAPAAVEAEPRDGPGPPNPNTGPATVPPQGPPMAPPPEPILEASAKRLFQLSRLRQADPRQYPNMSTSDFRAWAGAACGAASFATLVNAVDPARGMTVGQAVEVLTARGLISPRRGLLRREDFGDVACALNDAVGRQDAAHAVKLRSPEQVREHFRTGGGPVMFTGPSPAVWGVPHIYVATGATNGGLQILDSSEAARTFLTWPEWQTQTGTPGEGAGVALNPSA